MKDLKYLCIFGGGGVRGYSYLGVQEYFEQTGFTPQRYAGSSVGAIFATFMAFGMNSKQIEELFSNVNYELFKDINFKISSAFSISKGEVFLNWLREHLAVAFYHDNYSENIDKPILFKDLDTELYILATDLITSRPFFFSKYTTPDFEIAEAVKISSTFPGLIAPVRYEDKYLVDGDLLKSCPLWRHHELLCPDDMRVLEFRLEGTNSDKEIKSILSYFNSVYTTMTNYSTDYIMDVYAHKDKFDYIKINTKDVIVVNFNVTQDARNELKQAGYETTKNYFENILPEKQSLLKREYTIILSILKKLYSEIKNNNVIQSKIMLGELFIELSRMKKYIDIKNYLDIIDLKDLIKLSYSKSWFGKEKIKDHKVLLNLLKRIITDIENHCRE